MAVRTDERADVLPDDLALGRHFEQPPPLAFADQGVTPQQPLCAAPLGLASTPTGKADRLSDWACRHPNDRLGNTRETRVKSAASGLGDTLGYPSGPPSPDVREPSGLHRRSPAGLVRSLCAGKNAEGGGDQDLQCGDRNSSGPNLCRTQFDLARIRTRLPGSGHVQGFSERRPGSRWPDGRGLEEVTRRTGVWSNLFESLRAEPGIESLTSRWPSELRDAPFSRPPGCGFWPCI